MDEKLKEMIAHHDSWAATCDSDIARMALYDRITRENIRCFLPAAGGDPILDAGGGTGFRAVEIAAPGRRVTTERPRGSSRGSCAEAERSSPPSTFAHRLSDGWADTDSPSLLHAPVQDGREIFREVGGRTYGFLTPQRYFERIIAERALAVPGRPCVAVSERPCVPAAGPRGTNT